MAKSSHLVLAKVSFVSTGKSWQTLLELLYSELVVGCTMCPCGFLRVCVLNGVISCTPGPGELCSIKSPSLCSLSLCGEAPQLNR